MIKNQNFNSTKQKCARFIPRILTLFLILSIFVLVGMFSPTKAEAATTSVDTFAELNSACQKSGTVQITSKIAVTDTITIPKDVTVYLTCSHDADSTTTDIYRAQGFHGHLFKVNDGGTLYVRCAIDGNNKDGSGNLRGTGANGTESSGYYGQAMILNYGHVIMDNGKSVLKNNYNAYNNDYKSGVLWTYNGTKYYGLSSGGEGETDLSGSAVLCVNGKFTMSNGQIYGCYADNGPAIYVCNGYAGDVIKISGGKIHDNIARRYGGAIFAASRKPYSAYDNSSSFVGSRTLNSSGSNALVTVSGGSIYKNLSRLNSGAIWVGFGGTFYMSGGSIYSNVAVEEGGGAMRLNAGGSGTTGGWMCFANPGGQAWIAGGSIYSNTCATNGGAITVPDNADSNNLLKITGGSIYSNTAGGNGGGVYIGSKLTMSGGSIYKNKVNGDASKGGGIYLTGTATGTISNGYVYSNTAVSNGGGVSAYGDLKVSGGYFYGNSPFGISFLKTGTVSGGRFGFSAYSSYSSYTVSRNETGQIHTGADATVKITGGTSRMASALKSDEGIAANVGIRNNGTLTVDSSCNADNGYLDIYGTGTSIYNTGTLNINGKMNIMTSSQDGLGVQNRRGIYNSGTVTVSGDLSIRYCGARAVYNAGTFDLNAGNFYGNAFTGNGGAVYNTGVFRMAGGAMYSNSATEAGGAVCNGGDGSRFNMSGGSLYDNSSGAMGGAVYYSSAGLTSRISGGNIYNNTAGTYGGAIASYRTNTFYISGGKIYSNTATSGGGAVYNGGTLSLESNADINKNNAGTHGGGIYNSGTAAVVTMSGGKIYSNSATSNGGGIYNTSSEATGGKLTMTGGSIYSNTAGSHGAGVYFTTAGEASAISGGSIYSNTATKYGGGICSYRESGLTLSGSSNIYSNSGTHGGGVFSSTGPLKFSSTIKTNSASYGGGIYTGSSITISSGTIDGNTASQKGGGIYSAASTTVTMTAGTISNNTAKYYGGGLLSSGVFTMSNTAKVDGNKTEQYGGGIHNAGGTLNLNGGSIINNTSNSVGGGVCNYGTAKLAGVSIKNNSAVSGAGLFMDEEGTTTMSAGAISNNVAQNYGGGVCVDTGTFTLSGGEISYNSTVTFLSNGGGIHNNGNVVMTGGSIHHNTLPLNADLTDGNTSETEGGGISSGADASVKISGGSIYNNVASSGGGVFAFGGTFDMSGGSIYSNTSEYNGGGLSSNIATLSLTGGSIYSNTSPKGSGIYNSSLSTINMSGSFIVKGGNDTYLGGKTYISVPSAFSYSGLVSPINCDNKNAGRIVAKSGYGNKVGSELLYYQDLNQRFTLTFDKTASGDTAYLRAGDQGAASNSGSGISTADVFISVKYNISFKGNLEGITVTVPNSIYKYWYETQNNVTFADAKAAVTYYDFVGWNTSASGSGATYTSPYTYSANSNIVLYAQWNELTYTVVFQPGDVAATGTMADQVIRHDVSTPLNPNKYEKPGYKFDHWKDENGNTYKDKEYVKNLSNEDGGVVELIAVWAPIQYTVRFNANGGIGTMADQILTYDLEQKLNPNTYLLTDYMFVGWATVADGSVTYSDQQSVKNLASTNGQVVTLYAVWRPANDEGPTIQAVDRWFRLEEAKAGAITYTELMTTAIVEDSPIGDYTDFAYGEGVFTLIDFSPEDFTALNGAGSVSVTYYARDNGGNEAFETIMVYVVDDTGPVIPDAIVPVGKVEVRFISYEFYLNDDDDFVGAETGGLSSNSRWVLDHTYVSVLTNVLQNNNSSGSWSKEPVFSFTLDRNNIDSMKGFVETHGVGSSLSMFFDTFLK